MNKKSINNLIALILFVSILVFGIFIRGCESQICEDIKHLYKYKVNGIIYKKYMKDTSGRMVGYLEILNNDKIITIPWAHEFAEFKIIEKGDSVIKFSNSFSFDFKNNNKYIGTINFDCKK